MAKGNHRPNGKTIKSAEHLYKLLDEYIQEKGFYDDARSFGSNSWRDFEAKESGSRQEPNVWKYHVLVSIQGFMLFIDRNKNFYKMYIDRLKSDELKLEIDAQVRMKLYEHNARGNSLKHINDMVFNQWYAVTFEREKSDLAKELKKQEIELKKAELELKKAELERSKNGITSNVMQVQIVESVPNE